MLDIIYQDESIVVCVKPFRVLSTDEPGGMPDRIREAIGQPQAKGPHRPPAGPGGGRPDGLRPHRPRRLRAVPADPGGYVSEGISGRRPLAAPV
ncbi:MAG: hypothetical protein ACLUNZ_09105 [Evtepia sp.]